MSEALHPSTSSATVAAASTKTPDVPDASSNIDDDWQQHLGPESDPMSSIVFRFPDGSKEQKSLPCSSTLLVNIVYFFFHSTFSSVFSTTF